MERRKKRGGEEEMNGWEQFGYGFCWSLGALLAVIGVAWLTVVLAGVIMGLRIWFQTRKERG